MTLIYALVDPRTDVLRYVGKTKSPKKRLSRHCNVKPSDRTHRGCWLRGLKARGLRPIMEVLEEVENELADDAERFWIASFRAAGADLVNRLDGGDGGPTMTGKTMSQVAREKIAKAHIGMRPSQETRRLMSQMRTGRKQSPESVEKRRRALLGKKQSPEAVRNRSVSLRAAWARRKSLQNAAGISPTGEVDLATFCAIAWAPK